MLLSLLLYASTPQAAALNTVGSQVHRAPVVVRVNRAGSYATVLTRGGIIEGAPVTGAVLVKRFSFGWQTLDLLNKSCNQLQFLDRKTAAVLMRGMPAHQKAKGPCEIFADSGSPGDLVAVRELMHGPFIPYVSVSHDWALGEWYGAGGGEALFHKVRGAWKLVTRGGGAMNASEARKLGVPRRDLCALHFYEAPC
jgi:hypothetical protein